ncbi:PA-phosphatase-like phosphoesterase [Pontibacter sp. HJ8]
MGTTTAVAGEGKGVSRKNMFIVAALSLGYLLLSYLLVGFKTDQLVLVGLANLLYFVTPITRKFITGFSIFIVFWVLYDYMKAFPNYWFNPVHIEDLYNTEKALFGIRSSGTLLTPNEFWLQNSTAFLDVMSGVFYLSWIPVPLAFAGFLFFRNRRQFIYFSLTFLLVNLLGFVVYYLYPAAPPWYVQLFGFEFIATTPGNTAGLVRFDEFFGITVFHSLYAKGSNVFAAMPSLHSAYPLLVFYYALKNRLGLSANILFGIITVGIWFAAVYTSHHYVLDVLAGIVCASCGILLFNWLVARKGVFSRGIDRFVAAIS